MGFVLWVLAVVLVIVGIVLIAIGLAVGPGGYSIFRSRSAS